MTLPRVNALARHWLRYPPVHVSVADALGTGKLAPQDPATAQAEVEQFIDAQPTMHIQRPQ